MPKTFINLKDGCPFQIGDLVECVDAKFRATVVDIDYEHVFLVSETGSEFYRTWSHNNGGLALKWRDPARQAC